MLVAKISFHKLICKLYLSFIGLSLLLDANIEIPLINQLMFSNKIKGCLFGYAIGDALGIGTEFMTRDEIKLRYPEGLHDYSQIITDAHRSQWEKGDFSADTRFVELLAESMIEKQGIDYLHYAQKLKNWYESDEMTDTGPHIRLVLQQPDFTENPIEVSLKIYKCQGHNEAHNEQLGRAMMLGLWPGEYEQNVIENCKITHPDSKCISSSIIIAAMANELLWHRREADYDLLIGIAKRTDENIIPYLEAARYGTLEDFELDDEDTYWYSRKTMGSALWALWNHTDPEKALYEIIDYGGDADTNAALALGLLGLKYGYSNLPHNLTENLLNYNRLNTLSDKLIATLQKADKSKDTDE